MAQMSHLTTPLGRVLPRRVRAFIDDALADTRVVIVNGARQSGKTTLLRQLVDARGARWRTLDAEPERRAALDDPVSFAASPTLLAIDEIQRAPDLVLAIKAQVDDDPRPGQYLLTGSARLLGLRSLPDSLVGRSETIELWPFSQGEIDGTADAFVDAIFTHGPSLEVSSTETRDDYGRRIARGGFPTAVAREDPIRRGRFFDSYIRDLIQRDVIQLSDVSKLPEMRALIRLLAARSGQLLVTASVGSSAGLNRDTAARYIALLEEVFLIKRIPAWSRNVSTRAVGSPKVAIVDSGLACAIVGTGAANVMSGPHAGSLLEGFVLMELARQIGWSRERVDLYHYRTRDQVEVDAILETPDGRVVGIEVKASATVRADDFRGLRHVAERMGEQFVAGVVLYSGRHSLSFGPGMRAMPISALWEASP
jgi:hypothetical protein